MYFFLHFAIFIVELLADDGTNGTKIRNEASEQTQIKEKAAASPVSE